MCGPADDHSAIKGALNLHIRSSAFLHYMGLQWRVKENEVHKETNGK